MLGDSLLLILFIIFLFCLYKKIYEQYINKSKTAKIVLLFQILIALFIIVLINKKTSTILILFLLIFFTHIFIVDMEKMLIPYSSLIGIIVISVINIILEKKGLIEYSIVIVTLKNRIISCIIFIILWIVCLIIQKVIKKEYIGYGDMMLFCVVSLILGFNATLIGIFIASILALIFYFFNRKKQIPFGPFLVIGFLMVLIYYEI